MTESDSARFWKYVDRSSGPHACWLWIGYKNDAGYGEFKLNGKSEMAYRVAYQLSGQALLPYIVVRHRCQNTACVNPAHLTHGTHTDNVADRVAAHRSACGEHHGRSKLTWPAVRDIRRRYYAEQAAQGALAKEYGVTRRTIRFVVKGQHWREVL